MSDTFKEWWTGPYGKWSLRCEWPTTMIEAAEMAFESQQEIINSLTTRYDDAMKRIADLTAELEYLRLEVNRG